MDLLQSTPLGSPYAVQKARSMLAGDFSPAFALKHALKDAELAAQAARASGASLTLTSALLPRWRRTRSKSSTGSIRVSRTPTCLNSNRRPIARKRDWSARGRSS